MAEYDISRLNVLVADQSPLLCDTLRGVLRALGVNRVHSCDSVNEAFNSFCMTGHDLVLADWTPSFDGIGLLLRIRNDDASPNPTVPIIMMTAHTERRHIYEALDAGVTEYVAKPVTASIIFQRIQAVIESNRSFVRTERFFGPDRRRRDAARRGPERRRRDPRAVPTVPADLVPA